MAGSTIDPRDLRVSDAERAHVMSLLEKATGRGLINLAEFDERIVIRRTLETWDEVLDPPLGVPATD